LDLKNPFFVVETSVLSKGLFFGGRNEYQITIYLILKSKEIRKLNYAYTDEKTRITVILVQKP